MASVVNHNDGAAYVLFMDPKEAKTLASLLAMISWEGEIGQTIKDILTPLYEEGLDVQDFAYEGVGPDTIWVFKEAT